MTKDLEWDFGRFLKGFLGLERGGFYLGFLGFLEVFLVEDPKGFLEVFSRFKWLGFPMVCGWFSMLKKCRFC